MYPRQSTVSENDASLTESSTDSVFLLASLPHPGASPGVVYTYLVLLIVTTLMGNIGNVFVIGAVVVDKRLWKEGNIFIVNLAIADLCVTDYFTYCLLAAVVFWNSLTHWAILAELAFVDVFSIAGVFMGKSYFENRNVLCHIIASVCLVSCVCSLWSIAAISVNRYILLCRQHIYYRIFTWKKTLLIALALWTGSFLLDLPNFLDWGGHSYDMKTMACSYDRTASYSYTVFFITMFVTIPLFTVLFCNINIYIVVVRSKLRVAAHRAGAAPPPNSTALAIGEPTLTNEDPSRVMYTVLEDDPSTRDTHHAQGTKSTKLSPPVNGTETQSGELHSRSLATISGSQKMAPRAARPKRRDMKSEVKLAKTLFIVFIVFCCCWSPYALICLIDKYDEIVLEVYAFSIWLAHASSTLNSVLYAVTNKGFRDGYKTFYYKITCRK